MNKPEGLLDRLTALTGVEYLSDLLTIDYEIIRTKLPEIEPKEYPLSQWLDAAEYLTGSKPDTNDVQKIYEQLIQFKTDK